MLAWHLLRFYIRKDLYHLDRKWPENESSIGPSL